MKPIPLKEIFRGMYYKGVIPNYKDAREEIIEEAGVRENNSISVNVIPSSLNAQDEWWSVFKPSEMIKGLDSQEENKNLEDKVLKIHSEQPNYRNRFKSFKGDVRNLPSSIFSRALDIILLGVCRKDFYYVLPEGQGEISMIDVSENYSGGRMLKTLRLNPDQTRNTVFAPCLSFYRNKKERFGISKSIYLHTSNHYNNSLRKLMFTAYEHKFATVNILTNRELVYQLRRFYWDVPKEFIRVVLRNGFRYYRKYSQYNMSIISRRPKLGKSVAVSYAMVITHSRFYNHYHRPRTSDVRRLTARLNRGKTWKFYNGYYYVGLSDREFLNLKSYVLVNKRHDLHMEHAMLEPEKRPHIIAVKVPKPLIYKESFRKNIDYEKTDIKHVWSWDGSRFRTSSNSK